MSIDWSRFCDVIESGQRFVLTSHIRPDCDALGSELAMAGVLRARGKQVTIINGHETPPNLAFIDPQNEIKAIGVDCDLDTLPEFDTLMVLDTSAWAQLGPMGDVIKSTSAKKILLDHHVSEDDLGAELFKNTEAEATGRLVVEAADALHVPLTAEIAAPAFAAIATDTGWFHFGSTTSYTYEIAARLIEAGASPSAIYASLYERDTLGRVRLRGEVLARVRVEMDGAFAHTYILKDDFARTGALPSDTEDLVNMALAIEGTKVAVILVEQLSGGFKISFRSRCDLSCSRVAEHFGGGGHKAAAGAFIAGEFDEVKQSVLEYVQSELAALC